MPALTASWPDSVVAPSAVTFATEGATEVMEGATVRPATFIPVFLSTVAR
ncbi:hypothetical protein [Oryzifoliimicrobium ureilyticus]